MVRKAVIPAAGYGTRFLPATKSQPKEMLPVVDTPTIQYVVQEAIDAGITDILMIIGRGKRSIEEHFARNAELEDELRRKGKLDELRAIQVVPDEVRIHFVWQNDQRGLGDAIRHAKNHVGNEPFAVLLGDTILESQLDKPVIAQLIDVYNQHEEAVVALEQVDESRVSRYGIADAELIDDRTYKVTDLIEKPSPGDAPSNLAIASRYVLPPEIFPALEMIQEGAGGEVQLTDALRLLLQERSMCGYRIQGRRHDIGNKLDFIKTSVLFGLRREDMGSELQEWLLNLAAGLRSKA